MLCFTSCSCAVLCSTATWQRNKSPAVSQSLCFTAFTHDTRAAPCLPCTARAMMCCTGAVLWLTRVCAAVHPSSLTGLGFTVLLHPGLELTSGSAGLACAYW